MAVPTRPVVNGVESEPEPPWLRRRVSQAGGTVSGGRRPRLQVKRENARDRWWLRKPERAGEGETPLKMRGSVASMSADQATDAEDLEVALAESLNVAADALSAQGSLEENGQCEVLFWSDDEFQDSCSVSSISARVGWHVDFVEFHLRNGQSRQYGDPKGGVEVGPWKLEIDEHIVLVEQENPHVGYLGSCLTFQTSKGRRIQLKNAPKKRRETVSLEAPAGAEVQGLVFDGGRLVNTITGLHPAREARVAQTLKDPAMPRGRTEVEAARRMFGRAAEDARLTCS